jgi:hypothetical protein
LPSAGRQNLIPIGAGKLTPIAASAHENHIFEETMHRSVSVTLKKSLYLTPISGELTGTIYSHLYLVGPWTSGKQMVAGIIN